MHAHVKAKKYQQHVHSMIVSGRANLPDGRWVGISEARLDLKARSRAEAQSGLAGSRSKSAR